MKLIYRIALHMSWALSLLLAVWAALFYFAVMEEVNDEMDDSLDMTSERIVKRVLAGRTLPAPNDFGTNYLLREVSAEFAGEHPRVAYTDETVYIPEKEETEPARVLRTIFRDAGGQYRELTVIAPTIEKSDLQEAILWWIVWLYLLLLVAVLVVNLLLLHRMLRPLYALLRWLDAYTVGSVRAPLDCQTDVVEFRRLTDAVSRSAERTEALFEQQKQFIGNASHEMQTPLAVCCNRLEMLVGDGSTLTEGQLEEVVKVRRTLDYLVRLNKSLLLLSKIENGQFPESEQVDLNRLVRRTTEDMTEIYALRGLGFTLHEKDDLQVRMNPSLAESLITNLVKNAFVHCVPGGQVEVWVSSGVLRVCNSGSEPLDARRLFERFYQGTRKEGSTGLGLAIADAICRYYGLRITYAFSRGQHCFEVRFAK